jgi:hypothetical protein
LTDISTYLRILDEIRITDQERETSNLQVQDGQLRWQLPAADFGTREIQFEDEEARRLSDLLETWPKVTIRDVAWIERVVSDLKIELPATAEGAHKNARRKG